MVWWWAHILNVEEQRCLPFLLPPLGNYVSGACVHQSHHPSLLQQLDFSIFFSVIFYVLVYPFSHWNMGASPLVPGQVWHYFFIAIFSLHVFLRLQISTNFLKILRHSFLFSNLYMIAQVSSLSLSNHMIQYFFLAWTFVYIIASWEWWPPTSHEVAPTFRYKKPFSRIKHTFWVLPYRNFMKALGFTWTSI